MSAKVITMAVRASAWGSGSVNASGGATSRIGGRPGGPPASCSNRLVPCPSTTTPISTRISERESSSVKPVP